LEQYLRRFRRRDQALLDPSRKDVTVDRIIEHIGGDDAIMLQVRDKHQRFPVTVRHFVDQQFALRAPAMLASLPVDSLHHTLSRLGIPPDSVKA
jgi:hypothetical protein